MTKKEALAKELGIVVEDLKEIEENTFEDINTGYEYWVLTEDEADEEFYEQEKSIIEELKGEAFRDPDFILNYINKDLFDDIIREESENYVNDLTDKELIKEAIDHDIITEEEAENLDIISLEDLRDDLIDNLTDVDDSLEWFIDNFGKKEAIKIAFENDAVDYDGLIDEIQFEDGRGPTLGYYDGIEHWISGTDYYYYRMN